MDESSLRLAPAPAAGLLAPPPTMSVGELRGRALIAPLAQRRAAMSYLAVIAAEDDIQALLPQVVITNDRMLTQRDFEVLRCAFAGTRVQVWRKKSAWANSDVVAEWVRALSSALAAVRPAPWVILTMDACPTHWTERVVRVAAERGVLMHFVPARMTHVLQPLDTHVFASLKADGHGQLERARLRSIDGSITNAEATRCWLECIARRMSQRGFPEAFASVGLTRHQASLGVRCRRALSLPEAWAPPMGDLPSLTDLYAVAGRPRRLPIAWMFHLLHARRSVSHAPPPPLAVMRAPRPPALETESWLARLRPRSRSLESLPSDSEAWGTPETSSAAPRGRRRTRASARMRPKAIARARPQPPRRPARETAHEPRPSRR